MSDLDISIVKLFKQYYPIINHETLDNDILAMLIENMFVIEKAKYSDSETDSDSESISDPVIEENYAIATHLIPNQIDSGDMICVQGRINQVPLNILFDSGCQTSTTFISVVNKVGLSHLIDKKARTHCNGIGGVTKTLGMIWCTQLDLKLNSNHNDQTNNYTSVPIKLSVISDVSSDENFNTNQVDILIGTDFMKASNCIIDFNKKTICLNGMELHY